VATSQNGWRVHTTSTPLKPLPWITGRVRRGAVFTVFDHLCRRFDAEVEPIIVGHSWGWAYRPVRGQATGYSNHASATAVDLNAPAHPLGARGTFTPSQAATIRAILTDFDGVIRWGGDYVNRPDEMHFEVNANRAAVRAVARKLRRGTRRTPNITAFRLAPTVKLRKAAARKVVARGSAQDKRLAQAWLDARASLEAAQKDAAAARRALIAKEVS